MNNEQALERGSGRTTRLIKALPSGSALIVHSEGMREYVTPFLQQQGRGDIDVGTMVGLKAICRGKKYVGFDHVVLEEGCLLDLTDDERRMLRTKDIYVLDEMAMPTCIPGSEIA